MKQSSLSPARLAAMAVRPRKSFGFTVSCGLACLGLLALPLTASSITFVGIESGPTAENWSDMAVVKAFDVNNNDRYGNDGYYQITPSATVDTWSDTAAEGNDLGISALYPTLHSRPAFLVTNPAGGGGNYYIFDTNPFYSNPAGDAQLRQGSLAVSVSNYDATAPGDVLGNWCNAFTFTLDEAAHFRLGVAVDTVSYSDYAPDYVSVSNVNTGEVFSTALTRDGVSDMVFFDIKGSAGDEFAVNLWQTNTEMSTGGPVAFGLITFDLKPFPVLSYARNGGNFIISWQSWITGWTLESSTDLDANDDWTPVGGVDNNSVTVPMTGAPKNFFRLKESP